MCQGLATLILRLFTGTRGLHPLLTVSVKCVRASLQNGTPHAREAWRALQTRATCVQLYTVEKHEKHNAVATFDSLKRHVETVVLNDAVLEFGGSQQVEVDVGI